MLLTPCGVDFANTLLYHLKPLQLSFFPFFLFSPTLSEGYDTRPVLHCTCTRGLPPVINVCAWVKTDLHRVYSRIPLIERSVSHMIDRQTFRSVPCMEQQFY